MAGRRLIEITAPSAWRVAGGVAAGLCTCLLGLGLARFAYTPLIPALIAAHWFSPGQAVYLGAANIAGYLAGALGARVLAARLGVRVTLRAAMLVATASLFACAQQLGFAWFVGWRLASGISGAMLMVLAAPSILPLVPVRHRGLASGVIFTGIGLGIAASGTLLPALLARGVAVSWLALGTAGLCTTVLAWFLLPPDRPPASAAAGHRLSPALRALCAAYAISAMGQVPSMLFLADFIARQLHLGLDAGARSWAVFGVGALAGPLVAGLAADRLGSVAALRWLWVSQCAANLVLVWMAWTGQALPIPGAFAAAVAGGGIPGLVVLVLGRSQELCGPAPAARGHAWARATTAFALGQTAGAAALSVLFAHHGGYVLLFAAGTLAMLVALGCGEVSQHRADGAPAAV